MVKTHYKVVDGLRITVAAVDCLLALPASGWAACKCSRVTLRCLERDGLVERQVIAQQNRTAGAPRGWGRIPPIRLTEKGRRIQRTL